MMLTMNAYNVRNIQDNHLCGHCFKTIQYIKNMWQVTTINLFLIRLFVSVFYHCMHYFKTIKYIKNMW